MAEERNLRKVRQGIVVSDKMDKTVVVAVERKVPHKLYKKSINTTSKFKVLPMKDMTIIIEEKQVWIR